MKYKVYSFVTPLILIFIAYYTEFGKPLVLPIVYHTASTIHSEQTNFIEHVPMLGWPPFTNLVTKLILGSNSVAIQEQRAFSIQTASLCGALRIGAEFLHRVLNYKIVYLSKPSPKAHSEPFLFAGFTVRNYHYWSKKYLSINFDRLKEDLMEAPEHSVVIIQTSGHNPTGSDLSKEQWSIVCNLVKKRNLFPFFIMSYQGLVSGDLDEDAYGIQLFAENGLELFSAQSYEAKFGMYSERTGNMTIVLNNPDCVKPVQAHLKDIAGCLYSYPTLFAVKIIRHIIETPTLFQEWKNNLKVVSTRLINNRRALLDMLLKLKTPGDWSHIVKQWGLYCNLDLNRKQLLFLIKNKHIYLYRDGIINVSGITKNNVEYIAKAIHEATILNK